MRSKDALKGTDVNSCNACIGRCKMAETVEKFKNERRKTTKAAVFCCGGEGRESGGE